MDAITHKHVLVLPQLQGVLADSCGQSGALNMHRGFLQSWLILQCVALGCLCLLRVYITVPCQALHLDPCLVSHGGCMWYGNVCVGDVK